MSHREILRTPGLCRGVDRGSLGPDEAWRLCVDGRDVAPLLVAWSARARLTGLLGQHGFQGAVLLLGVRSVHSIGMRFPLDVARCDAGLVVRRVDSMGPGRVLAPRRGVRHTLEAEAGSFAAWAIVPGAALTITRGG